MPRRGQVHGVSGDEGEPIGWREKIKAVPLDTRTAQQKFFGDPPAGRSAYDIKKRETENGHRRTPFDPRDQGH